MASTNETGHAKNVAHLKELISYCKTYQEKYNPARMSLTIKGLEDLLHRSEAELQQVKTTKIDLNKFTIVRQAKFKDLKPFATQIVNAFAAAGASKAEITGAQSYIRKMQGKRAKAIEEVVITDPEAESTVPEAQEDKHISVAQTSYDNLVEHFSKLVETVSLFDGYKPNEAELSAQGLQSTLKTLQETNQSVIDRYTLWSAARISRDTALYTPIVGLFDTAADVKKYVKSVFKASSPQYRQISGLKFTKVKS